MINILFICHGNICRSPMGEFLLKHLTKEEGISSQFHIESCATSTEEIGRSLHPGAKAKLDAMGIPNQRRQARQLTRQDYDQFDYLLCMDFKSNTLHTFYFPLLKHFTAFYQS